MHLTWGLIFALDVAWRLAGDWPAPSGRHAGPHRAGRRGRFALTAA
jgi:hypothetical protein